MKIAVVIPTRNRADLAISAACSLLEQDCELDIFVSDNSSSPDALQQFCRAESRVRYLRPQSELSMPEHWDFAVRRAMELSDATHFSVHYDRKISKAGSWPRLIRCAEQWPDRTLSFSCDFISHQPPPLRVWQAPWTGKAFALATRHVAKLLAGGQVGAISHALPVLSNCIVPRAILEEVVDQFGDLCNSTGPDSAFMWRFFALRDDYIHIDRTESISYARERSNGLGYLRGKGGDFADFLETFGDRPWLDAAPVPGVNLGHNMLYHEHELVRRATGERLPELDRAAVLDDLASFLPWVENPKRRSELGRLLREHGWAGPEPQPLPPRPFRSTLADKRARFRMWWHGEVPPHICGFSFRTDATALRFALRYPRQAEPDLGHLALLRPVEVAA